MSVKQPFVALDESVAARASEVAERDALSLSAWLDAAARRALVLDAGLEGVREWEVEQGELSAEELGWADGVLGTDRAVS